MHSSVDGYLGCFQVLAIVNTAAVNIGIHMSFIIMVFSVCPVVGLLGHTVDLFLVFKGISILFSVVTISVYISNNYAAGFPYLHILSSIYCL